MKFRTMLALAAVILVFAGGVKADDNRVPGASLPMGGVQYISNPQTSNTVPAFIVAADGQNCPGGVCAVSGARFAPVREQGWYGPPDGVRAGAGASSGGRVGVFGRIRERLQNRPRLLGAGGGGCGR